MTIAAPKNAKAATSDQKIIESINIMNANAPKPRQSTALMALRPRPVDRKLRFELAGQDTGPALSRCAKTITDSGMTTSSRTRGSAVASGIMRGQVTCGDRCRVGEAGCVAVSRFCTASVII
jgi:hypothetical protein